MSQIEKNDKRFCSCPSDSCPNHPNNHTKGCDPCIRKNLLAGEIPACFWLSVSDNFEGVTEYTTESFVRFYLKHNGVPNNLSAQS